MINQSGLKLPPFVLNFTSLVLLLGLFLLSLSIGVADFSWQNFFLNCLAVHRQTLAIYR